jgi:hypothetical protein
VILSSPQKAITEWARSRLPGNTRWNSGTFALGLADGAGNPKAAVVFHDYTGPMIACSIVAEKPLTRDFLGTCFHYAFNAAGVRRLNVLVEATNHESIALARRLGASEEHRLRDAGDHGDAIMLAFFKEDAQRWLRYARLPDDVQTPSDKVN